MGAAKKEKTWLYLGKAMLTRKAGTSFGLHQAGVVVAGRYDADFAAALLHDDGEDDACFDEVRILLDGVVDGADVGFGVAGSQQFRLVQVEEGVEVFPRVSRGEVGGWA